MATVTHLHPLLQLLHADGVGLDGVVDLVKVLDGHLLDSQAFFLESRCGLFLAVGVEVLLLSEVPGLLEVLYLVFEGYAEAHRPAIFAFSSFLYRLHVQHEGFRQEIHFLANFRCIFGPPLTS